MYRLTRSTAGRWVIVALGMGIQGCSDGASPAEPTVKRLEVQNAIPRQVPYRLWSEVTVQGRNLDGVRDAFVSSPEGVKRATILEPGSSEMSIQIPPHEWFGQVQVILSEGNESFHERDTLPFRLELVGPDPNDTRIFEYRDFNGQARRWDRSRLPLSVYPGQFLSAADRDTAIAGIESWSNTIEHGIPSFIFVEDSLEADVIFSVSPFGQPLCSAVMFPLTAGAELMQLIDRVQIGCIRDFFEGAFLPRDLRVLAAHETGHALGLHGHSKRPTDLMGEGGFGGRDPSPSDILTLRHLYTAN